MGALGNVSGSNLIGVGIACGGNVLISLALTLQKLAHRRNEEAVQAGRGDDGEDNNDDDSSENGLDGQITSDRLRRGHSKSTSRGHAEANRQPNGHLKQVPSPIPEELERSTSTLGGASLRPASRKAASSENTMDRNDQVDEALRVELADADQDGSVLGLETGSELTAVPVVIVPPTPVATTTERFGQTARSESPASAHRRNDNSARKGVSSGQDEQQDRRDRAVHGQGQNRSRTRSTDEHGRRTQVDEGMYLRSRLWWCGMVLIALGEGGNFLSYGFAPASVVAPLGTVALIANCIFAPLILRERFYRRELFGMALAILGAVTVVWSSNGSNPRLNPAQLITALKRLPFILYTIVNFLLLAFLILISNTSWGHRYIYVDIGITCLFGGYTVLSTKALSSLLSNDFFGAWQDGITWFLVAVVAGTSLGQIRWLNRALMRFQSKEVIPTQFVFFSLAAIIGSAVLFQEFDHVPFSRFVNFAFGIATTFVGVHLLTSTPNDQDSASDDGEESDEHGSPRRSLPVNPQRASSSASLNLLLPSAVGSERTPLLAPGPVAIHPSSLREGSAAVPSSIVVVGSGSGRGRIRLSKRTSTSEFTPTLGLGSQAGLLLMATTPPGPNLGGMGARGRSSSRTGLGLGMSREDAESGSIRESGTRRGSGSVGRGSVR
ncbi:hypothetical protein IAU60_004961 [Kwoniella sp. DSM 27419]